MKLRQPALVLLIVFTALFSISCIDLVFSLQPWFDVDDVAIADPRLAGWWCLDDTDGDCSANNRMEFVPGPGESWNVLAGGELRHRVWLAEIGGERYLDWMFLCEPSLDTASDDCRDMDLPLGGHLLTQITLQQDDRVEFSMLKEKPLADLLTYSALTVEHGKVSEGLVMLADSEALGELLAAHGRQYELWEEEPVVMSRLRTKLPVGRD